MINEQPLLYFNFKHHQNDKPIAFTKPVNIIQTDCFNEVTNCLNQVQKAINDGYYAAGYVTYEAAAGFYEEIHWKGDQSLPLLWFGIFKEPANIEVARKRDKPFHTTEWMPNIPIQEYNETFDRIHTYIKEGETEQVNYTIQMEAEFSGDPFAFYKQLEEAQDAKYCAYLHIDSFSILSASPELFFHMKDRKITTKPMKGTVGRGKTYAEDRKNAHWLKHSKKNRHENKLIVELMKSELNKVAKPNSVSVPSKFEIEQYPTVFQMTSTVTADLENKTTIADLFTSLFPCGSITGLPKQRTMELINEYEKQPRGIYCGAIGYITPNDEAIFNVPIRTVFIDHTSNNAIYGVGGAITVDSTKEEEYEEVITKAKILTQKQSTFQLLETLRLENGEYLVLENHIERLRQSAIYFNFPFNETQLSNQLTSIATNNSDNNYIVRVLLHKDGSFEFTQKQLVTSDMPAQVALATKPIHPENPFLYHKTTNRKVYEEHIDNNFYDVLLWNEDEQITEFTKGNIVVELDGVLVTPPVTCGLLPGTFRKHLLEQGIIVESIITKRDLHRCTSIWFINSVRKWIPVELA